MIDELTLLRPQVEEFIGEHYAAELPAFSRTWSTIVDALSTTAAESSTANAFTATRDKIRSISTVTGLSSAIQSNLDELLFAFFDTRRNLQGIHTKRALTMDVLKNAVEDALEHSRLTDEQRQRAAALLPHLVAATLDIPYEFQSESAQSPVPERRFVEWCEFGESKSTFQHLLLADVDKRYRSEGLSPTLNLMVDEDINEIVIRRLNANSGKQSETTINGLAPRHRHVLACILQAFRRNMDLSIDILKGYAYPKGEPDGVDVRLNATKYLSEANKLLASVFDDILSHERGDNFISLKNREAFTFVWIRESENRSKLIE